MSAPTHAPVATAPALRRILGIAIDWAACLLIAKGIFQVDPTAPGQGTFVPLGILLVEHTLLVGLLGTSLGHRIAGIAVRTYDGGAVPGLGRAAARSILLCLVIPAVIWDAAGRGMHDRWAGTMIVRDGQGA